MSAQRILGIDPGLRVTGFGVIEMHGQQLRYVASGCIKSSDKDLLPARIATLFAGISEVIATYRPDQSAIEKVFVNVNPQSTLLLGQARGAAICAAVSRDLPVHEYSPMQIKGAVVGRGAADKTQVQYMTSMLLGIEKTLQADAADALAVAITHAHTRTLAQRTGVAASALIRRRGGR